MKIDKIKIKEVLEKTMSDLERAYAQKDNNLITHMYIERSQERITDLINMISCE